MENILHIHLGESISNFLVEIQKKKYVRDATYLFTLLQVNLFNSYIKTVISKQIYQLNQNENWKEEKHKLLQLLYFWYFCLANLKWNHK